MAMKKETEADFLNKLNEKREIKQKEIQRLIEKFNLDLEIIVELFADALVIIDDAMELPDDLLNPDRDSFDVSCAFISKMQKSTHLHTSQKIYSIDELRELSQIELLLQLSRARNSKIKSMLTGIIKEQTTHAKRNGKKGSTVRHAPTNELKAWMLQRYSEGKWPSANKAAYDLKEIVITHGKTINAHLTEENAQRTIAEWINEHKKHTT
jgi:hypothetical protein